MYQQPEVTTLSKEELHLYLELQKKVGWRRTGTTVFQSFFPLLPFVPFELAVVREIGHRTHILMWHRNDEHYCGWHMPGGYILLGENDQQVVERVLTKEVGLKLRSWEFIRCFNTRPETGWVPNHQMAKFYHCIAEGEPSTGQFFPVDHLPERTLAHHIRYVEHLRAFLLRRKTMMERGIHHDGFDRAPEGKWLVVPLNTLDHLSNIICETLAEAVEVTRKNSGRNAFLLDDEGHQIL